MATKISMYQEPIEDEEYIINPYTINHDVFFGYKLDENLFKQKFSKIKDMLTMTSENRGISQKHITEIYDYYNLNPEAFIQPLHIISYYKPNRGEQFLIADGQHRVEALKRLLSNEIDRDVLYFVHDADNEQDIKKIIKELNSSKPIDSLFDFDKRNEFIKKIESEFDKIFSLNENHHDFKMNKIKLRDALDNIKLFEKINLTVEEIYCKLDEFNMAVKNDFSFKKKSTNEKDLYMKIAQTHGFYCLMYRDYLWVNKFYIYLKNEV